MDMRIEGKIAAALCLTFASARSAGGGHSPVEDALATLRLLKLHRQHRGPPPPRVVTLRLTAAQTPDPPASISVLSAADVDEVHIGDKGGGCSTASPDWLLQFEWSTMAVGDLLDWWCLATGNGVGGDRDEGGQDEGRQDEGGNSSCSSSGSMAGGLVFPPSLQKDHRSILHKEARKHGLATWSHGIGPSRCVTVMPCGVNGPVASQRTRRIAALAYRWAVIAAEQDFEEAMATPYSMGEVEELVEAAEARDGGDGDGKENGQEYHDGEPLTRTVLTLIRRAATALRTLPTVEAAEPVARRVRDDYELSLAVQGRSSSVLSASKTKANTGSGADWRRRAKR